MCSVVISFLRNAWQLKKIDSIKKLVSSNIIFLDRYGTIVNGKNLSCEIIEIFFSKLEDYAMVSFEVIKTVSVTSNINLVIIESTFEKNHDTNDTILLINTCILQDNELVFYQFNNKCHDESIKNSDQNVYVSKWPL